MITCEMIKTATAELCEAWGTDGEKVIEACHKASPFNNTINEFLKHCTMCGGDWGAMLLTGIKTLYPDVWDAIPNNMGLSAFLMLAHTLTLCGVDLSEQE